MDLATWETFRQLVDRRRAVRDFTGEAVADEDMEAILAAAQLAPSSSNTQPYELHWVRDPSLRARVAEACRGQRAAATAGALVVVVARFRGVVDTYEQFLAHVDADPAYDADARAHHRARLGDVRLLAGRSIRARAVGLAARAILAVVALVTPHVLLAPLGPGAHHWAARNSIFAAQTLLLAAVARGLDACPMEGFDPIRVARLLDLRGVVIPLVVAVGRRADDARIEPRWRRPFHDAVVVH